MALAFGTTDETYGLTQSVSVRKSAEIADARDGSGKINAQKAYSVTTERTVSVLTTGTIPVIGTVDATHGIVSASTEGETNTGYETGEVTFQKKDAATQTAIA
jgi:hypothetical protein